MKKKRKKRLEYMQISQSTDLISSQTRHFCYPPYPLSNYQLKLPRYIKRAIKELIDAKQQNHL